MDIVVRATVVFWLLWVVLRATGKRELAELTPFELILIIVMGDLVQQGVNGDDQSLTGAALAVTTMMLWTLLLSYAVFKLPLARRAFQSLPTVLVRNGEVDRRALRMQRMTVDELLDEARQAGIADVGEVSVAILEADGKVSFLRAPSEEGP